MDRDEWYFQPGYVEILYAVMVISIAAALYFFRRSGRMSGFTADMEESGKLLAMLALAIVLFVLNRVLGDLW